jgi:hypothetical protein
VRERERESERASERARERARVCVLERDLSPVQWRLATDRRAFVNVQAQAQGFNPDEEEDEEHESEPEDDGEDSVTAAPTRTQRPPQASMYVLCERDGGVQVEEEDDEEEDDDDDEEFEDEDGDGSDGSFIDHPLAHEVLN